MFGQVRGIKRTKMNKTHLAIYIGIIISGIIILFKNFWLGLVILWICIIIPVVYFFKITDIKKEGELDD